MSQYDRPMSSRSRSVPPTARLAGGSAPTPAAPTPAAAAAAAATPSRPSIDASKWATKALTDFIEQKANMGHNSSHPEPSSQAPVGASVPRGRSSRRGPGQAAQSASGFRVNLSNTSNISSSSGGGGGGGEDTHAQTAAASAPQPIRSLKRRVGPQAYGPSSSPFATDLTPKAAPPRSNQT